MRHLFIAALLAFAGSAQQQKPDDVDRLRFFQASASLSLSGTAGAITIQLPAKSGSRVYLQSAVLKCSVACTVTQERNGSAATATAATAVALNGGAATAATLYGSSNTTGGAALIPLSLSAGQQLALDMSASAFSRNSDSVQNHTWRVSAITGTFEVGAIWGER